MRAPLLPLLLAACQRGSAPLGADSGAASPDQDQDGTAAPADCDDDDAAVHPGAAERCDGVDQDCDGAVDEGVPGDGAGCQDPGWPELPAVVEVVHLSHRTGEGESDGTDDGAMELCLTETLCLDPTNSEWDDFQRGAVEVVAWEGLGVDRAAFDRFAWSTGEGEDAWRPAGFQLSLDDAPVYCREADGLVIGADAGEEDDWTDPEGLHLGCETIWDAVLTHGPLLGAIGPDDARISFRTDATRQVRVRFAADAALLADADPAAVLYPRAADDFTAEVRVEGLGSDTAWVFDLEIDGARFGPWSLRTAPAAGAPGSLRLAFGSCTKDDEQPVFEAVRAWAPDLFLFVGDAHYGDTHSLSTLRQNYRWAHSREGRDALQAETSTLATWDDHDYLGNNTGGDEPDRDIALRAFAEAWANPALGTEDAPGTFFQQDWGDVALFVLDARSYRGVDGDILGAAQTAWLLDALEASTATFKLVASGSQFAPDAEGDTWGEVEEAWEELLDALAARQIGGLVLLSGDVHRMELRLLDGGPLGYELPEITSSPLARAPAQCADAAGALQFCWDEGSGFVGLEIDTAQSDPRLVAVVMDEEGAEVGRMELRRSELGP